MTARLMAKWLIFYRLIFSFSQKMGACLSNEKLPDNVFIVRNIHDDHRRFPKGIIEVTNVELKYKDIKSGDEWVWPLKYLRKYGCDRDIFSFEAGRKCPGGEGLYAFSTKKASQLFDMVARNISEGGLEGEGALSPPNGNLVPSHSPMSLVPSPHPPPPPPPVSDPPTHPPALPQYQNMAYQDGQPGIPNAEMASATPPPVPPSLPKERRLSTNSTPSPPPRVNYTEVSLLEPSDPSIPAEGKEEKRVSYTQIDIKQTEEYNKQMARLQAESAHPLPDLGNAEFKLVTPSDQRSRSKMSPCPPSASSSTSSGAANAAHRSMSDGNVTFSGNKQISKPNGSIPGRSYSHSGSALPDQVQLYQNVRIVPGMTVPPSSSPIPEVQESPLQQQVNYMNITPQQQPQQTYENLKPGQGITSPPGAVSFSPPRGPMGVYADLVLHNTSTPKGRRTSSSDQHPHDDDNHCTLNFSSGSSIVNNTPAPRERSQTSIQQPPNERNRSTTEVSVPTVTPADTVNYSTMDFRMTEALRKTKEEREEEIRQRTEEEAREEERRKKEETDKLANTGKKKAKKHKKRDRRNSHQ